MTGQLRCRAAPSPSSLLPVPRRWVRQRHSRRVCKSKGVHHRRRVGPCWGAPCCGPPRGRPQSTAGRGGQVMAMGRTAAISATTASLPHKLGSFLPTGTSIGVVLGPLVGLVIWGLPLTLNPAAHRAFAIVGFLLVYWMTETMEHGITALIVWLLLRVLPVSPPEIAFSGFTSPAAWFL